jgi:hypothetical protein
MRNIIWDATIGKDPNRCTDGNQRADSVAVKELARQHRNDIEGPGSIRKVKLYAFAAIMSASYDSLADR